MEKEGGNEPCTPLSYAYCDAMADKFIFFIFNKISNARYASTQWRLLALCDSVVGNDNLATPLWFCFFKVVVAESFLFSSRRGVRAIVLSFKTRGLEFEILQTSLVLVRRGMSNLKYYIALAKSLVRKRVSSCGRHTLMQQV